MRRIFFILTLFFISQFLFSQTQAAKEKNNYETIISYLRDSNTVFEIRPLLRDFGGFTSSVHVRIPGTLSEPDHQAENDEIPYTFVLTLPMQSDFAVQTALDVIAGAKNRSGQLRADILIAFLGDEKSLLYDDQYDHKGLRDLISLSDLPDTWIVCYLDIDSSPESFVIRHGSGDYIAPLELVEPLPALFKNRKIPVSFEVRYNELYKLGLTGGSKELTLLWQGEINGISIVSGRDSGREKTDAGVLADMLLDYAQIVSPQYNPDRHYILLSMPGIVFYNSEKTSVFLLFFILTLLILGLLLFSALKRIILISRVRLFLRHCWIFIILLPLMVLIIRGAGLFFTFLQNVFNAPAAGTDFGGSIVIFLLAGWLFILLSRLLDILPFSRKANFLGVSVIILSAFGLFAAAALEFDFIAVLLWGFIFAFLGALSKKPLVIIIFALLIPIRILGVLNNIRETGNIPVYLFITQGGFRNWAATFQIALLCLPVILLLKRAMTILRQNKNWIFNKGSNAQKKGPSSHTIFLAFHTGIFLILVTLIVININFSFAEQEEAGRSILQDAGLVSIALNESVFQESRVVNVSLASPVNPLKFNLFLKSDNGETPQVYSAPVPFERQEDNSLIFVLGENPPNPLNLEIVLRKDFTGSFWPQAIYEESIVIGQAQSTTGIAE